MRNEKGLVQLLNILNIVAHFGRFVLIAGLVAGLSLPDLAVAIRPWIPEFIAALLLVTAVRIGPKAAMGGLEQAWASLIVVLALQLALPLLALAILALTGLIAHPLGFIIVLMLSAPAITGAPNFVVMLGQDPAPALRLLVIGTALFPFTVLATLFLLPGMGDPAAVLGVASRLLGVIMVTVAVGFATHHFFLSRPSAHQTGALDGVATLLQAVVVIGLMSAVGPAIATAPMSVLGWLGAAFAINFGLQLGAGILWERTPEMAARSVAAGNRNIALFLVALPEAVIDPILLFIGCYQIPMYLTPSLMRRVYGEKPIKS